MNTLQDTEIEQLVQEMAKVLRDLLKDKYLADPINNDRMDPVRAVLSKYNQKVRRGKKSKTTS